MFRAFTAAMLATRGVVDLDRPVTQYVPEMKLPDGLAPKRVTLRTLLTHTSGLRNDAIVDRTAFTGEHTPALSSTNRRHTAERTPTICTESDLARIELIPGTGEVLRFTFADGPVAASVKWRDQIFQRVT